MRLRKRYIFWVLGGIWLAATVALAPRLVALHRETRDLRETFANYGNSLVKGDLTAAYQYCGSNFRHAMSYEEFASMQRSLQAKYGNLMRVEEAGYHIEGTGKPISWRAVIHGNFQYEKQMLSMEVVLHKENGQWVIFGIEEL